MADSPKNKTVSAFVETADMIERITDILETKANEGSNLKVTVSRASALRTIVDFYLDGHPEIKEQL